jgi:RNA polymerase sigma-70 factor (ECF subfamily)
MSSSILDASPVASSEGSQTGGPTLRRIAISVKRFQTTRWSLVLTGGAGTDDAAREELLCTYWPPLYAYLRRSGHDHEDALDLTQGFFARLLERNDLARLDPARGRFRSFLLASLRHFVADERERATTAKRRPEFPLLSLDELASGSGFEPVDSTTPEQAFEREWIRRVLERALERLRSSVPDPQRFERLQVYLTGEGEAPPQSEIADELGMSEGALRVAVHRLRHRFGDALRAEIASTVGSDEEVEDELRHLLRVLAS